MTERQRLQRARMLFKHRIAGRPPAAAWRKVNPGTEASDKSAAEMCGRELSWFRRWLVEHPGEVPPAGDWRQEPKRCIGVADRPCGVEISRRQKRCTACAAGQKLLNQPGYGLNYYRSHPETANTKRNERRLRQHQRERDAAAAAAEQKKREHRANLPREVEYERKKYRYHPKTGTFGATATSTTRSGNSFPSRRDIPSRQYRRKFPCPPATGGSGSVRPASPAEHRGRTDGPASSRTSQPHRGRTERPQRTGPARSAAVRPVRTLTEPRSTRSCCRASLSVPSAAATGSAPAP